MNNLNDNKIFVMIPEETLDELILAIKDLKQIKEGLERESQSGILSDFITEDKAKELIGRGTTWFWNNRKSGELPGKKAAGRWYYNLKDIKKYIEDGRSI